jgi:hypothetical protein
LSVSDYLSPTLSSVLGPSARAPWGSRVFPALCTLPVQTIHWFGSSVITGMSPRRGFIPNQTLQRFVRSYHRFSLRRVSVRTNRLTGFFNSVITGIPRVEYPKSSIRLSKFSGNFLNKLPELSFLFWPLAMLRYWLLHTPLGVGREPVPRLSRRRGLASVLRLSSNVGLVLPSSDLSRSVAKPRELFGSVPRCVAPAPPGARLNRAVGPPKCVTQFSLVSKWGFHESREPGLLNLELCGWPSTDCVCARLPARALWPQCPSSRVSRVDDLTP